MNFIKSFFSIIVISFGGIAFGLLCPLLFVLTVIFPRLRKNVANFADSLDDKEEISPILFTIYSIVESEMELYSSPKIMIICENVDLQQSIAMEYNSVKSDYEFSLMVLSEYIEGLENRDVTYSYYYIGSDISVQPPAGVLESFYFNVKGK